MCASLPIALSLSIKSLYNSSRHSLLADAWAGPVGGGTLISHLPRIFFLTCFPMILISCASDPYAVNTCNPKNGIQLPTEQIPSLGNPDSGVKITVFGDITCPITKHLIVLLEDFIRSEDGVSIELFYRHLLRSSSSPSMDAAQALTAANQQGSEFFWTLYWRLMIIDDLSRESILAAAEASVPDPAAFRQAVTSSEVSTAVEQDDALGHELGFAGVPGVVLCGQKTSGTPEDILENVRYLARNAVDSETD